MLMKGTELAVMETRRYSLDPLHTLSHGLDSESATRGKYPHIISLLQEDLHGYSAPNRIPSLWCWGGRLSLCGLGEGLGKASSIPLGQRPLDSQQCMGWSEWP